MTKKFIFWVERQFCLVCSYKMKAGGKILHVHIISNMYLINKRNACIRETAKLCVFVHVFKREGEGGPFIGRQVPVMLWYAARI